MKCQFLASAVIRNILKRINITVYHFSWISNPLSEKKKDKKKKKKIANIVSFGEDDDGAYSSSPSSVKSPTLSVTDYSGAHHKFSFSNSNPVWSEELTEKDSNSAILTMTTNPSEERLRGNNSSQAEEDLDKLSSGQENSLISADVALSSAEGTKEENSVIEQNSGRLKLSLGKDKGNSEITRSRSPNRSPHRSPRSSDHEPSITSISSVERPSSHGSFSSADVEET